MPDNISGDINEVISEGISGTNSKGFPGKIFERIPEQISRGISKGNLEKIMEGFDEGITAYNNSWENP